MMDNLFNISFWLDQINQHALLVVQHAIHCYAAMYLGKKLRSRGFGASRYLAAVFGIICFRIITIIICIDETDQQNPQRAIVAWTIECVTMLPFCYVLARLLDYINASNYLAIPVHVASFALWIAVPMASREHTCTEIILMAKFHAPLVISMLGGQVLAQYGRIALQYGIPFLVIIGLHPEHGIWGLMLRYMPARCHFGEMVYLATTMVLGVILHLNSAPEVIAQQPTNQLAQPPVANVLKRRRAQGGILPVYNAKPR